MRVNTVKFCSLHSDLTVLQQFPPHRGGWTHSQPAGSLADPGRESCLHAQRCSTLIFSERGLLVMDSESARSQEPWCGRGGVHLLEAQRSMWARAFKREQSQRQENRDDAEASQRLTESRAKVKLLSMQRFKCCRVKSFTGFTFLPNTPSKYKSSGKRSRL